MKKRWLVYALLLLLSVGLFGCAGGGATTVPPAPQRRPLRVVHRRRSPDAQRLFSVDASQVFYYADQKMAALFAVGSPPRGRGLTWSPARIPTTRGSFPRQELLYDGNGFSLTIEGERHSFQKIDDVPAVIGDPSYYS